MTSSNRSNSISCPYGAREVRPGGPICACYAQPNDEGLDGNQVAQPRCSYHPLSCEYLAAAKAVKVPTVPEGRRAEFQLTA